MTKSIIINTKTANHIIMIWNEIINSGDVDRAVREIEQHLILADEPVTIVVDLSANPRYAVHNAMSRILKNDNIKGLRIVGDNKQAVITASVLQGLTRRKDIEWYPTLNRAVAVARNG
ncbi:MAG: hypothetical protein L0154_18755 [Chloroflexi bacterium]|nr:hypothetical protein [Chloroflexota bacterium]